MTKRRASGYGRRYADVQFVVDKPHDKLLIEAGWTVLTSTAEASVFEYTCSNRYAGDDETVVYELYGDLPSGFDTGHLSIDWASSVY